MTAIKHLNQKITDQKKKKKNEVIFSVKDCTGQVQKSVLFYLVCKNSVTAK